MPPPDEPDTDSDHDSQSFDRANPAETVWAFDDAQAVDHPIATLDESGRRLFNLAIEYIVTIPPVEAYEVGVRTMC
jgi:hypothetical protein